MYHLYSLSGIMPKTLIVCPFLIEDDFTCPRSVRFGGFSITCHRISNMKIRAGTRHIHMQIKEHITQPFQSSTQ